MVRFSHFVWAFAFLVLVAGQSAADSPEPDLTGHWSGCWISESDGHHGPLNATFRKIDETQYRVQFHGRFLKVIPFRYSVTLNVIGRDGEKVLLAGSQHLGPVFGTFEYTATATENAFTATFTSKKDTGRFELSQSCR